MKKRANVVYQDVYDLIDQEWTAAEVAENLGCSTATVYRALQKRRDGAKTPTAVPRTNPALSLEVRLPATGPVEVKVRNGEGTLRGTLTLTDGGVTFRRPNQKAGADRLLSWDTLDRVMQLGIA